jgi:hypothetical protein
MCAAASGRWRLLIGSKMERRGSGLGLYSPEMHQEWKVEIEEGDSAVGNFGKVMSSSAWGGRQRTDGWGQGVSGRERTWARSQSWASGKLGLARGAERGKEEWAARLGVGLRERQWCCWAARAGWAEARGQ